MSIAPQQFEAAPALPFRIWTPDDEDVAAAVVPDPRRYAAAPALPPVKPPHAAIGGEGEFSPRMTLSEFFERWYLRVVLKLSAEEVRNLKLGQREWRKMKLSEADMRKFPNAVNYQQSIDYWKHLTGDPPIYAISDVLLVDFEAALRGVTYKRGLNGTERRLGDFTVAKHLKNIRAVLFRCGPKNADNKRPGKGLLDETPHISVSAPTLTLPKKRFSLKQARLVYAACDEMTLFTNRGRGRPSDGGPDAPAWWRALVSVMFYTGLRIGTVLRLEWSMIEEDEDGFWFKVPGRIVHKTKKASVKALRLDCLELLHRLPRGGDATSRIFTWNHSLTHLRDRHDRLQKLAGVKELRDMHAWKRTHLREVARTCLDDAMETAQRAGDHADRKTTEESYVNLGQETARLMPSLVEKDPDHDPQRNLF